MPCLPARRINKEVRAFCRKVCERGPGPVIVPVHPVQGAAYKNCFLNVEAHVEQAGGSVVYGWMIAIWPGVFGEAVHHAVWRSPDGTLRDITPQDPLAVLKVEQIVFVEDSEATYDKTQYKARLSRRIALVDALVVREYLAACQKKDELIRDAGPGGKLSPQLEEAIVNRTHAHRRLLAKKLGPNDQCPCMSGRKFKKCCRTLSAFEARMMEMATRGR